MINYDQQEYELRHWGIKGQKWGVRNYRNEDGTLTEAGKARYNNDGSHKKAYEMSDEDLRRSNARLIAENQYNQLSQTSGQKFRKSVAKIGASAVGSALATGLSTYLIGNLKNAGQKDQKVLIGESIAMALIAGVGAEISGAVSSLGGQVSTQSPGTYFQGYDNSKKKKKGEDSK